METTHFVFVCEDKLEVRYKLDSSRDADVLRSRVRNVANGQLHSITIRRLSDSVSLQVTHTHTQTHSPHVEGLCRNSLLYVICD